MYPHVETNIKVFIEDFTDFELKGTGMSQPGLDNPKECPPRIITANKEHNLVHVIYEGEDGHRWHADHTQKRFDAIILERLLLRTLNEEQIRIYRKCIDAIRAADEEDRLYD